MLTIWQVGHKLTNLLWPYFHPFSPIWAYLRVLWSCISYL